MENTPHAVLKKAKAGDYRVQDDFGGSVEDYFPMMMKLNLLKNR